MARRQWIFLSNTFEVQTRGSYKRMLSLASKTHSCLAAQISDPVIAGLYTDFDPVFRDYTSLYSHYHSESGSRKGNTFNLKTLLLNTLMKKLARWEGVVRAVYTEGTPDEVAIFPNKRTPFFHGTYENRINAVNTLAVALQAKPLLAATALQVQSFYNVLNAAREQQIQKKGLTARASNLLESQRKLVAEALWGILGRLMDKYRKNPDYVKSYFDLTLLRKRKKQDEEENDEEMLKAA